MIHICLFFWLWAKKIFKPKIKMPYMMNIPNNNFMYYFILVRIGSRTFGLQLGRKSRRPSNDGRLKQRWLFPLDARRRLRHRLDVRLHGHPTSRRHPWHSATKARTLSGSNQLFQVSTHLREFQRLVSRCGSRLSRNSFERSQVFGSSDEQTFQRLRQNFTANGKQVKSNSRN